MERLGRLGRIGILLIASASTLPLSGCATADTPPGEAQGERLPLADLHFHFHLVRGLSPEEVLRAMDRAGVRWAGNGGFAPDEVWLPFVQAVPDRFLLFAGQGPIRVLTRDHGEAAWTLRSPEMTRYLTPASFRRAATQQTHPSCSAC